MDGGGDNQLTARYTRRPLNRRVEIIMQDYQRWRRQRAININRQQLEQQQQLADPRFNTMYRHPHSPAGRLAAEAEDSGFESDSESDLL
ncbi:hypothetical protein KR093_007176 [Drosophila rubida]|uniref:Uncharacterized protein n=1 Tax=Drosophila rubida TaxID=30044 RepID=A0AAD4K0J7_9MUSC|nr:hypothetical protein KR093_007176 [Drosophila rubida]